MEDVSLQTGRGRNLGHWHEHQPAVAPGAICYVRLSIGLFDVSGNINLLSKKGNSL